MIDGSNNGITPNVDMNGIQTSFNHTPVTSILAMDELQLSANGKHRLVKVLTRKKVKNLADFILFTDDFTATSDVSRTKLARVRNVGPSVVKCAQQVRHYLVSNERHGVQAEQNINVPIATTDDIDTASAKTTHRIIVTNLQSANNILRTKLEHSTRMVSILEDALKSRGVTV